MEGMKVTVKIKTHTLSIDSVPALLRKLADEIAMESASGKIVMADGDQVMWTAKSKPVKF